MSGPLIRAEGLGKRYGDKRVLEGLDLRRRAGRVPARHRPERLGEDDAAPHVRGAGGADRGHARSGRAARDDRLRRPRPARLSRADRDREPRPVRPALPRARAARTDRHAARTLRSLAGTERARRLVLARHAAAAVALPRRCSTSRACSSSTSRTATSTQPAPSCSTTSSPTFARRRRSSSRPTIRPESSGLASSLLAFA